MTTRRPCAVATIALPSRIGHGRRVHPLQPVERVDRQLVEHAVAGKVGDDPGDLVGRQPPADAGEVRDEPRDGAAAVHQLRQGPLVRREPQVAGLAPVGRAHHHVVDATRGRQGDGLDLGAQDRPGPGRVEPVRDRLPQTWVGGAPRGPRGAPGEGLPDTDARLDDGHDRS
jgi:hypothetical protein